MTRITSLYSDRALTVEITNTFEVQLSIPRVAGDIAFVAVPRCELLHALDAADGSTLDETAAALAQAREQRDLARKETGALKSVIDRSIVIDRADLPKVTERMGIVLPGIYGGTSVWVEEDGTLTNRWTAVLAQLEGDDLATDGELDIYRRRQRLTQRWIEAAVELGHHPEPLSHPHATSNRTPPTGDTP